MNIYKIYCVILFILYILYMDDNWVLRSANTTAGLMCVTYGNGKFVATGYYAIHPNHEPKIIYSFNGITWTTVNFMTGFHYSWNAVIYANGLYFTNQPNLGNLSFISFTIFLSTLFNLFRSIVFSTISSNISSIYIHSQKFFTLIII